MTTEIYYCSDCCGSGCSCCGCTTVANSWTFTVTGITAGAACTGTCVSLNGDFTLLYFSSCKWSTEDSNGCNSDASYILYCDGTNWILQTTCIAGGNFNRWKKSVGTWNCTGTNVLTLTDSNCCSTLPDTITLTPSEDNLICSSCCPGDFLPTTIHMTISGTASGCDGTYALVYDASLLGWKTTVSIGTCPTGSKPAVFLECSAGIWGLFIDGGLIAGDYNSLSCNPFDIIYDTVTELTSCCGATGKIEFTI